MLLHMISEPVPLSTRCHVLLHIKYTYMFVWNPISLNFLFLGFIEFPMTKILGIQLLPHYRSETYRLTCMYLWGFFSFFFGVKFHTVAKFFKENCSRLSTIFWKNPKICIVFTTFFWVPWIEIWQFFRTSFSEISDFLVLISYWVLANFCHWAFTEMYSNSTSDTNRGLYMKVSHHNFYYVTLHFI